MNSIIRKTITCLTINEQFASNSLAKYSYFEDGFKDRFSCVIDEYHKDTVRRVVNFYHNMKKTYEDVPFMYQPTGHWKDNTNRCSEYKKPLEKNDIGTLCNFSQAFLEIVVQKEYTQIMKK